MKEKNIKFNKCNDVGTTIYVAIDGKYAGYILISDKIIVKQNIVFAIFVKIMVLLLTAIGLSTMWMAVFVDVGVSIIAVLNALRCLKTKDIA